MPRDLLRVDRVDDWPTQQPGLTLYIVRGVTVEDQPHALELRTLKPFQAALCQRAMETDQLIWVEWADARHRQRNLVTVVLDTSKFVHDAEAV